MAGVALLTPPSTAPAPRILRRASHAHLSNPFLSLPRSLLLLRITPPRRHHHLPSSSSSSLTIRHRCRLKPCSALDADVPAPLHKGSESFEQWDSMTAKFAGASNIPFLLLQLPQIILNARNLLAGNNAALFAVPWLGMLTGLLGNLSLLSYFAKKREKEVVVVQTLGVASIYAVITQLAMAGAMPLPHFVVTSIVVACGLVTNFMYYYNFLGPPIWCLWEDFITVAGLSALPQVMWSTFVPYLPNSILPGEIAFVIAMTAVVMVNHPYLPFHVLLLEILYLLLKAKPTIRFWGVDLGSFFVKAFWSTSLRIFRLELIGTGNDKCKGKENGIVDLSPFF